MREFRQHGAKDLQEFFTAGVQRPELGFAIVRDDLERRTGGSDVPARIPPGILVSRGKINPTVPIQIAQKMYQALTEISLGESARDFDPVRSQIAVFTHKRGLSEITSE